MSPSPQFTHRISARARRITIKVELNGEVVVVTPKRYSPALMLQFVTQNVAWIEQIQAKLHQKKQQQYGDHGQTIHLFGKSYHKEVISLATQPHGTVIVGNICRINTLRSGQEQTLLTRFLKNTAEEYIVPRTHQLAQKMSITFKNITLRQQKTRWGSCSSQGNLNFNWRLVHAPPQVIDYVIIHELAHRQHMNHSARFWALVAKHDADYNLHRRWLHTHGMNVG